MIPIKDKNYMLNCQGPYDYNIYTGEGIYTGQTDIIDKKSIYGFRIPLTTEICYFLDKEIIAEFSDGGKLHANYSPDSPENYKVIQCKYRQMNLKEYECFQKQ